MKFKSLVLAGLLAVTGVFAVSAGDFVAAKVTCPVGSVWETEEKDSFAECNLPKDIDEQPSLMTTVTTIINVIVGVVAVIAVIVIVVGGIFFVTSTGDSAKIARARNTIIYGVVGLIVSLLAFAIVNFVLKAVFGGEEKSSDEDAYVQDIMVG